MSLTLPAMDLSDNPTGCCPLFDPGPWDGREFSFTGLSFVTATSRSFLYMPLNLGAVMTRTQKAISAAGAEARDRYLILSQDISPWKSIHRFLVGSEVPGMPLSGIDGSWLAKVFEGPYSQMSKWYKALTDTVAERGQKASELLAFYTTCPKCAKVYGKNYVVLFARLS